MTLLEQIQADYCPNRELSKNELKLINSIIDNLLDDGVPPSTDKIIDKLSKKTKDQNICENNDSKEMVKKISEKLGIPEEDIKIVSDDDELNEVRLTAKSPEMKEYLKNQIKLLLKMRKSTMEEIIKVDKSIDEIVAHDIQKGFLNAKTYIESALTLIAKEFTKKEQKELKVRKFTAEWEEPL